MVSRLHIVLLLALAAILFGARAETVRGVGAMHSGSTHYATECSFVNVDIIDMAVGCLPDAIKRLVPPALYVIVGFLTIFYVSQPKPLFSLYTYHFTPPQQLLRWGLAAGVISMPPDSYNKNEPVIRAASA